MSDPAKDKVQGAGSDKTSPTLKAPPATPKAKAKAGENVQEVLKDFIHDDPEVAKVNVERNSQNKSTLGQEARKNKNAEEKAKEDDLADLHTSKKVKAPAPQRNSKKNNKNYSQEFFEDDENNDSEKKPKKVSKTVSLGAISAPTDLEDDPEFQEARDLEIRRAAERKKQNEQFVRASKKPSKSKSRNWTQALGTAKYNPFLVGGTFGSVASSFGSMMGTMKKSPNKQLYGDNPLQLHFVKGFYKMMRAGDDPDDASIASNEVQRKPAKISAMLRKFKKLSTKNRENNRTLSQREIDIINRTARQSHMAELSPDEIQYIEERLQRENVQKKGCYAFMASCFDAIKGIRSEKAKQEEDADGTLVITEANGKSKSANRKSSGPKHDCNLCTLRISKKDAFSQASDPQTAEVVYFHTACIQCELCREVVGAPRTLRMKAAGVPVLCDTCQNDVEESEKLQKELHENLGDVNDTDYVVLAPQGRTKFVPVHVINPGNQPGLGLIPMCASSGVQFTAKDTEIASRGNKRWLQHVPKDSFLKARLVEDVKAVALGFPTELTFRVIGNSAILNKPLTQEFRFVKDNASLQFELRQKFKRGLAVIYNLARDQQNMFFNLDNVKCDSLTFEGIVVDGVGPFVAEQKVVKQEEKMRKTGNTVMMRGRFEHGILYDWLTKLHFNEKKNTLTPVALELTLRVPTV